MEDWSFIVYDILIGVFKLILSIFFREMRERGVWHVPRSGAILFVIAPHSNQFVDPLMVLKFSRRRVAFCCAAKTLRRRFVGAFAKALQSIPVERAQDLVFKGSGTLELVRKTFETFTLLGEGTNFTEQLTPRALVTVEGLKFEILSVESPLAATAKLISGLVDSLPSDGARLGFSVTPHISHEKMFAQVTERLESGGCVGIFPEGGSHDRSTFLPMKAGAAIMALTALSKNPQSPLQIVPVGLNYFKPYKFRSRAVIEFGPPIEVSSELVQQYKSGGASKRKAVASLMELVLLNLKALTVTASDYDTLMIIQAARRLYQVGRPLSAVEKLDLTRKVARGIDSKREDERVIALSKQVSEYNRFLRVYGLHDHQVMHTDMSSWRSLKVFFVRVCTILVVTPLMLPGLITHFPIVAAARYIASKKAKEALAASSVKVKGFDVLASWKIMVTAVVAPLLYIFYALVVLYVSFHYFNRSLLDSLWIVFCTMSTLATLGIVALALGDVYVPLLYSLKPLYLSLPFFNSVEFNPERVRKMRKGLSNAVTKLIDELKSTIPSEWDLLHPSSAAQSIRPRRSSTSDAQRAAAQESRGRFRKRSDSDTNGSAREAHDYRGSPRVPQRLSPTKPAAFDEGPPPELLPVEEPVATAESSYDSDDCSGFPLNWSRRDDDDDDHNWLGSAHMKSSVTSLSNMSASSCSSNCNSYTPTSPGYATRNSTPHILGTL